MAYAHHQQGWTIWSLDAAVEYQINDDFVRVRRWEGAQPQFSGWLKWQESTDATIRKLVWELDWEALPKHESCKSQVRIVTGRTAFSWLVDHLAHPFRRGSRKYRLIQLFEEQRKP